MDSAQWLHAVDACIIAFLATDFNVLHFNDAIVAC